MKKRGGLYRLIVVVGLVGSTELMTLGLGIAFSKRPPTVHFIDAFIATLVLAKYPLLASVAILSITAAFLGKWIASRNRSPVQKVQNSEKK